MSPRRKILPIFVPHVGCPNQCVFCNQRRISGSLFPATGETVRAALAGLEGAGYELAFYGGSFTAISAGEQEALLEAAQPYRQAGVVEAIRVSTRPDAIDAPTLERLRRYGVETVELGAQSMTDTVLARSGRGHSAADTVRAARLLHQYGFQVILQMMTGLPGETPESSLATARALIALEPEGVRIYPTVVIRETPLEAAWRRGEYREHSVEDAVAVCAALLPLFEAAGIPVIRLGLNPTPALSQGDAVAGAYHPALGELVRARLWRNRAERLLEGVEPGAEATILAPARLLSQVIGQGRSNLRWLEERFGLKSVKVIADPVEKVENLHLRIAKSG